MPLRITRPLLSIAAGFGLAITPILASANDVGTKPTAYKDSLQQTEARLNALIKAAARQELVNLNTPKKPAQALIQKPVQVIAPPKTCKLEDMLLFPDKSKIGDYSKLQILKAGLFMSPDTRVEDPINPERIGLDQIAPERIDVGKAKTLTSAYLGLGFGQEALNIADLLKQQDKLTAGIMARALIGTASKDDVVAMQAKVKCNPQAQIWLYLITEKYTALSDTQIQEYIVQTNQIPDALRKKLVQTLGIKAAQNGDLKTANALYQALVNEDGDLEAENRVTRSVDLQFFAALLAINSEDAKIKSGGIKKIKIFAKSEGYYQAFALQALALHSPLRKTVEETYYPGYIQDLDASAQIYSAHAIGKQAQAQQIDILAQNQNYLAAIGLAKTSVAPDSTYFVETKNTISAHVTSDLLGADERSQISALEIILSEGRLFATLENLVSLQQAGIHASAKLGLPELAKEIMPQGQWKSLDAQTLELLAASFETNHAGQDITALFPKTVFAQPKFKAKQIKKAFRTKNPAKARAVLRTSPNNEALQNAYINYAWQNGYWSLAANGYRDISREQPATKNQLAPVKPRLAATLSMVSPLLLRSGRPYEIQDLAALQSHLNTEIGLFKSYLKLDDFGNIGAENG